MKHTLICLLTVIVSMSSVGAAQAAETEISASGTGTISLPPDVADVRAEVVTTAGTATEATSQNNSLYDQVVAALSKLGVDRQDVSLDIYNVRYQSPNASRNPYEPAGYTVERSFSVTVRQIVRAGAISDACLSAGATSINGISFRLSAEDAIRAQATAKAVADARATAATLARAGGLHIVGIKAMQVGAFPGVSPIGGSLRTIAHVTAYSRQPTNLDESNVIVSVDVGVVFLAKP
jgi:uncharacterized protein YggE